MREGQAGRGRGLDEEREAWRAAGAHAHTTHPMAATDEVRQFIAVTP